MEQHLDPVAIYAELSNAITELHKRGLQHQVKWAAEQLVGLPEQAIDAGAKQAAAACTSAPDAEHPKLIQGRNYFELKEYQRAAHTLFGINTPVSVFLRCYALYLAGEKRKEEERIEASGPLGTATTVNPYLDQIQAELGAAVTAGVMRGDAFGLYLSALIAIDRDHRESARSLLVQSLKRFPCNWGAWQALVGLCDELEVVSGLDLPMHWSRHCFLAALCLELQHNAEALSRLQVINQLFPGSDWVASSAAMAHYNMRNFDEAQALYEDLLARDPARLAGMDTYSNILFVKEAFAPLSHLAHRLAASDKYTPEACCVIGNYYSLKGQHERAVESFRRALRLSRNYLSAWTLMGHEYVEMKNAPAAIDAYRAAVAVNPRDYRAWYGLGQTYELLSMPYYALYYYRRAAMLRPSDPRMWCALGHCYESEGLRMPSLALRCYRRAVAHGDREGIGLAKLAKLHEAQGDAAAAAHYYSLNLARLDAERVTGNDVTEALLYLAEYAKSCGRLADAEQYCQRLLDIGGPANMRAKAILRDMRSSNNTAAAAAAAAAGRAGSGSAAGPGSASAAAVGAGSGSRAVLGARRVLGDAVAAAGGGDGGSSWLSQQQQQYGYASPMAGNTPGAFSVVMDESDDEQQQQEEERTGGQYSDDHMQLAEATPLPPTVAAAPGAGVSTLLPTVAADSAAAAAAAAADHDMDMVTPAPFSFVIPTGRSALLPAAAAAVQVPTPISSSPGMMSTSDTPVIPRAAAAAAGRGGGGVPAPFPGFGFTPGITPPPPAAAAAVGSSELSAARPAGAAAARRANLLHLLAPGLEPRQGQGLQEYDVSAVTEQQQHLGVPDYVPGGLTVVTPASGSDVMTPFNDVIGGDRGLFATPPGGFSYDSPPAAATATPAAAAAPPPVRARAGARGGSSMLSPEAAAAAAELAASLSTRRSGTGRGGRSSGMGGSSSSTPAAAAAAAAQIDHQLVQHVIAVTGADEGVVEEALRESGGDMMHAIIAVEQRRST